MSRKYKVRNPVGLYFITCTTIGWVDLFTRSEYKDILMNALNYCIQNKGLQVHAYVIMTSHFHAIVSVKEGVELPNVMRDFKTFTSKSLVQEILRINESRREWMLNKFAYEAKRQLRGKHYKVWQDGYHPKELTDGKYVDATLAYIHNNPVSEGWVNEIDHYVYSSARSYAGGQGIITLSLL